MKKDRKERESGFTLIEIIAVLVILAVLAAVAIPRYISLIDEARDQALQGAVAAALSHVSMAYGRLCLANDAEPTGAELATECGVDLHITGYLSDADLAAEMGRIAVPVCAHRHYSASGSLIASISSGEGASGSVSRLRGASRCTVFTPNGCRTVAFAEGNAPSAFMLIAKRSMYFTPTTRRYPFSMVTCSSVPA